MREPFRVGPAAAALAEAAMLDGDAGTATAVDSHVAAALEKLGARNRKAPTTTKPSTLSTR